MWIVCTSLVALNWLLVFCVLQSGINFAVVAQPTTTKKKLVFAVIPKSLDNPFFNDAHDGCLDQAAQLGVECLWIAPNTTDSDIDGTLQANMIRQLLDYNAIHGLGVSCRQAKPCTQAIREARLLGIPVVTFDTDADPESGREVFIATDNYFFGGQIAKALKQLQPYGGTFAVVSGTFSNFLLRTKGFRDELLRKTTTGIWTELPGSPADYHANLTLSIELMQSFAEMNPTAIVPLMGAPMRSGRWKQFVDLNRGKSITLVSGDALPNQLAFLATNYVDGLVGQLPYEMGSETIKMLKHLVDGGTVETDFIGTNVLTHVKVPLVLPKLIVDDNRIGNLRFVGFALFGITATVAIGFAVWTCLMRNVYVFQVAQPLFLVVVCMGVLILSSSMVSLSFDDGGDPYSKTNYQKTWICMSTPWLAVLGFTITFLALFSKTMRINRVFQTSFRRVKVSAFNVLGPGLAILMVNVLLLTLWTILDPLVYVRIANPGLDGWNRVISTYGACRSTNASRFVIPLAVVNICILIIANWQAFMARNIQSEFSESRYISIAMASLLQSSLMGIPLLLVVRDSPEGYYLVIIFMIFIISMAVLLLIFIPKLLLVLRFKGASDQMQKRRISQAIRSSAHLSGTFDMSGIGRDDVMCFGESSNHFMAAKRKSSDSAGIGASPIHTPQQPPEVVEEDSEARTVKTQQILSKPNDDEESEATPTWECEKVKKATSKSLCNS